LEEFAGFDLAHLDTKKRVDVFALSIYGVSKMKMSNGGPLGGSLMKFCTDVETSTGSLYSGYRELL
ncbi:hypothetical protein Godav_004428, partial [Gossypium davidsonii]|nr:hypothetical protein [Gossypium davidsonii]MBA0662460.1 hypothetical protein [Gossypium klotzschianum]